MKGEEEVDARVEEAPKFRNGQRAEGRTRRRRGRRKRENCSKKSKRRDVEGIDFGAELRILL